MSSDPLRIDGWLVFVTPEQKKAAEPKRRGDEFYTDGRWLKTNAKSLKFDETVIYRRRIESCDKPALLTAIHSASQKTEQARQSENWMDAQAGALEQARLFQLLQLEEKLQQQES